MLQFIVRTAQRFTPSPKRNRLKSVIKGLPRSTDGLVALLEEHEINGDPGVPDTCVMARYFRKQGFRGSVWALMGAFGSVSIWDHGTRKTVILTPWSSTMGVVTRFDRGLLPSLDRTSLSPPAQVEVTTEVEKAKEAAAVG